MNISKVDDEKNILVFKINNRIDVLMPNPHNKAMTDAHSSRIEDMNSSGMSLAMPLSKGIPIILSPNEVFQGVMPLGDAAYEFSCIFYTKEGGEIPLWKVSLPYNIVRKQQRQFVRYDISIPVIVRPINQKEVLSLGELVFLKTKDISGGGLRLISKTPLAANSILGLTFEIPGHGEIIIDAKVIRSQRLEEESPLYWIAFEFLDISSKERNAIIQFIFKKQLEERRKFFKK